MPAAVYLDKPTPALSYLAGQLDRCRVHTIFGPEELESGVRTLLSQATQDLGGTLVRMLSVGMSIPKRLLALLDQERTLRVAKPDRLASELRCSRSALYRALRTAGLPPPGSIQALYRLWPGVTRIVAGGSGPDAAFEAQCPHYHSFRKAVLTHFGLTIGQLRGAPDLHSVLRRWVDFHQAGATPAAGRRPFAPLSSSQRHERHQPPSRVRPRSSG